MPSQPHHNYNHHHHHNNSNNSGSNSNNQHHNNNSAHQQQQQQQQQQQPQQQHQHGPNQQHTHGAPPPPPPHQQQQQSHPQPHQQQQHPQQQQQPQHPHAHQQPHPHPHPQHPQSAHIMQQQQQQHHQRPQAGQAPAPQGPQIPGQSPSQQLHQHPGTHPHAAHHQQPQSHPQQQHPNPHQQPHPHAHQHPQSAHMMQQQHHQRPQPGQAPPPPGPQIPGQPPSQQLHPGQHPGPHPHGHQQNHPPHPQQQHPHHQHPQSAHNMQQHHQRPQTSQVPPPQGPQIPGQPPSQQMHPSQHPGPHPHPHQQHPPPHPQHHPHHPQAFPFNGYYPVHLSSYPPHMMPYHPHMQAIPGPYPVGPMQANPALLNQQTRVITPEQMGGMMPQFGQLPNRTTPMSIQGPPMGQPTLIRQPMPPMTGMIPTQPMPPQQPPPPREKKRLAIIDPKTMRPLTEDELKTTPATTTNNASSSTNTPAVTTTATTTNATTNITATNISTITASSSHGSQSSSSKDPVTTAGIPSANPSTNTVARSTSRETLFTAPPQTIQSSTVDVAPNVALNDNSANLQVEPEIRPINTTPTISPLTTPCAAVTPSSVLNDRGDSITTIDSGARTDNMVQIQDDIKPTTNSNLYPKENGDTKVFKDEVDYKNAGQNETNECKSLHEGDNLSAKVASLSISDDTKKPDEKSATQDDGSKKESEPKATVSYNLPYDAGQFSPLNKNGSRRYSIKFLKAVATEKMKIDFKQQPLREDFSPHYMTNNYRDIPTQNSMRRQNQQTPSKPRKIIEIPIADQVPELITVENPWKPELGTEKAINDTTEMDTKRLIKVFRGHLNKLTPQKYDSIIQKIEELDLDGQERLNTVISLVFDKAVDEPGFCELYARMCKVIAGKNSEFCYHLVKKCQEEFETEDLYEGLDIDDRKAEIELEKDPVKRKTMNEELYEEMRIRRRKYLGTIKLIGEMYKLGLLAAKIIGLCMNHLIHSMNNENIECLCSLITTVGLRMANESDLIVKDGFANVLKVLNDVAHSKQVEDECFILESRIKFKILDTVDLSKRNWRPRITENKPQKLEEIRDEIKDELRQQHYSNINTNHQKNILRQHNDDRDRPGRGRPNTNNYSKWNK